MVSSLTFQFNFNHSHIQKHNNSTSFFRADLKQGDLEELEKTNSIEEIERFT